MRLWVYTSEWVFGCPILRIRCIHWEIGCTQKSKYFQKIWIWWIQSATFIIGSNTTKLILLEFTSTREVGDSRCLLSYLFQIRNISSWGLPSRHAIKVYLAATYPFNWSSCSQCYQPCIPLNRTFVWSAKWLCYSYKPVYHGKTSVNF